MEINVLWLIPVVIVCLIIGFIIGALVSRKMIEKQIKENPPINEKMIRAMYAQMGRKPTEKQIKQIMASSTVGK